MPSLPTPTTIHHLNQHPLPCTRSFSSPTDTILQSTIYIIPTYSHHPAQASPTPTTLHSAPFTPTYLQYLHPHPPPYTVLTHTHTHHPYHATPSSPTLTILHRPHQHPPSYAILTHTCHPTPFLLIPATLHHPHL